MYFHFRAFTLLCFYVIKYLVTFISCFPSDRQSIFEKSAFLFSVNSCILTYFRFQQGLKAEKRKKAAQGSLLLIT
ncbi:hypothetical protein B1B05_18625 [Domibacillus enclensis]|uniref:Secreted protein n=1 Tax=Domibacillus enclensis TaxID=1017273 RepID=A0ABX4E3Q3_9BACI|nr:hypothetical protein B1B05_18625 [Domibacillus enclensis]